jgi:uncharacterized protein (TIGR00369 family)
LSENVERRRTVTWEDPATGAEAAGKMGGLEYLRAVARGDLPAAPMANLMGFWPSEVEDGRVVFEVEPDEYHYNPIGAVHGGLACTLFDSAMGCAVHTTLPAGTGYTTVELKVNLLRPITAGSSARARPSTWGAASPPPGPASPTGTADSTGTPRRRV